MTIITSDAFAYKIINEEHYRSSGVLDVAPVILIPFNAKKPYVNNLYAKTANTTGEPNKSVLIPVWQKVCIGNNTSTAMQYGYRFDLMVGRDNLLDAQTFVLQPGEGFCPTREGYGNFNLPAKGIYTIIAITKGAEGSTVKEAKDQAVLTIK